MTTSQTRTWVPVGVQAHPWYGAAACATAPPQQASYLKPASILRILYQTLRSEYSKGILAYRGNVEVTVTSVGNLHIFQGAIFAPTDLNPGAFQIKLGALFETCEITFNYVQNNKHTYLGLEYMGIVIKRQ